LIGIPGKTIERRLTRGPVKKFHQLFGLAYRQGPEHQSVNQAEDCSVCTDSEGENKQYGRCEARRLFQLANRVAQVLDEPSNRLLLLVAQGD